MAKRKRPAQRKRERNPKKGGLVKTALIVGGVVVGAKLLHDHQQANTAAAAAQASQDLTVYPAGVSSTGASGGKRG